MNNAPKIKFKNLIMYGIGDLYGGGAFLILGTLFMIFLTDVVGISPVKAGLILIFSKLWDLIADPALGYISDNTHSRFGRRRIFFLIGIIPIAASFTLLWLPVNIQSENFKLLYYMLAYIFFSTVFSMITVPYTALNAEMSKDYKERNHLSGTRLIFSLVSAMMSGIFPKLIINSFQDPSRGYLFMGLIFGAIYAVPWIFVFLGTWELPIEQQKGRGGLRDLFQNYITIFVNKTFRVHMGMYIFAYTALDTMMTVFVYYLTYCLGHKDKFSLCMGLILASQVVFLPVAVRLCNRIGSGRTFRLGLSIWALAILCTLFYDSSTSIYLVLINCIFIGSGLPSGTMIPWSILPSTADVDEMITARKRAGTYSSMMTLLRKIVQATVTFVVGILLEAIGYIPNAVQSPDTLLKLKLIFAIAPVFFIIVGIIISIKYKVTPETHEVLMGEIERLRQGGRKEDAEHNTKCICEQLTGIEYSRLYTRNTENISG